MTRAAVLILLLASPAFAQTSPLQTNHSPGMAMDPMTMNGPHAGTTTSAQPQTAADAAMMASMEKMNQAMSSVPMTGNPDHDFAIMMIPHHKGAVDMAQWELDHGKDKQMRALATRIIADQKKEIATMTAWLKAHPVK